MVKFRIELVVGIHNSGNLEDLLFKATEEALSLSEEVGQAVHLHLSKDFISVERVAQTKRSFLNKTKKQRSTL